MQGDPQNSTATFGCRCTHRTRMLSNTSWSSCIAYHAVSVLLHDGVRVNFAGALTLGLSIGVGRSGRIGSEHRGPISGS